MVALVNIPKRGAGLSEGLNEGAGGAFCPLPPSDLIELEAKLVLSKDLTLQLVHPDFLTFRRPWV